MRPAMTAAIETTPPPAPAPRRTDVTPRHILSRRPPIVPNNAPIRPEIAHSVQKKDRKRQFAATKRQLALPVTKVRPHILSRSEEDFLKYQTVQGKNRPFDTLSIPFPSPHKRPNPSPSGPFLRHIRPHSRPTQRHRRRAAARRHWQPATDHWPLPFRPTGQAKEPL